MLCRGQESSKLKVPGSKTKSSSRTIQTPRSRRIVQSSNSEDSDSDSSPNVIDLTDGSPERPSKKNTKGKQVMPPRPALKKPSRSAPERAMPLYVDDDE